MMTPRLLSSSLEDYIETIYHLIDEKQSARVKDISRRLKVNYPSVTGALKALNKRNLVNYTPYEHVTLTPEGREIAADVIRRHEALRKFFVNVLSVEEHEADRAACEMEHAISKPILERIMRFVDFIETCPAGGAQWKEGLGYTCTHGIHAKKQTGSTKTKCPCKTQKKGRTRKKP
nr:metal-dependent transcriptional regulator [candidate division Zixibacteria bacterium]